MELCLTLDQDAAELLLRSLESISGSNEISLIYYGAMDSPMESDLRAFTRLVSNSLKWMQRDLCEGPLSEETV